MECLMASLFYREKQKMPHMVLLRAQDQAAQVCTVKALLSREALGAAPVEVSQALCSQKPAQPSLSAGILLLGRSWHVCDITGLVSLALRPLVTLWLLAPESHLQQN